MEHIQMQEFNIVRTFYSIHNKTRIGIKNKQDEMAYGKTGCFKGVPPKMMYEILKQLMNKNDINKQNKLDTWILEKAL